jgi:glycolate oxidase FAD binding subunit
MTVAARLRSLLGAAADSASAAGDIPRVRPPTVEGCALVLGEASQRGWRVRLEGTGCYGAGDAPADLVLSTAELTAVRDIAPADLVATTEAGARWDALASELSSRNLWVPIDPPAGVGPRSVGSVVATATAGPLRAGFGGVRDHLLGLTFVSGDGRVITAGGRVAKNVAGYDLTRLVTGSLSAFGMIAAVHWRLRVAPKADVTLTFAGARDALVHLSDDVIRLAPAAMAVELVSGSGSGSGSAWTLAVRLLGSEAAVSAGRRALTPLSPQELSPAPARQFWRDAGDAAAPVSFRMGTRRGDVCAACDLIGTHVPTGRLSAGVAAGGVRWSGAASAEQLIALRNAAAGYEMPLTVERASWPVLAAVGHFGAYREGVASLLAGLRRAFDPAGILVAPMDG